MNENNKMIALFMGFKLVGKELVDVDTEYSSHKLVEDFNVHMLFLLEEDEYPDYSYLSFNSHWDWLMPVIAKIRDLSKTVNEVEIDTWYEYMKEVLPFADIKSAYKYTVEFIQWYNKKNK